MNSSNLVSENQIPDYEMKEMNETTIEQTSDLLDDNLDFATPTQGDSQKPSPKKKKNKKNKQRDENLSKKVNAVPLINLNGKMESGNSDININGNNCINQDVLKKLAMEPSVLEFLGMKSNNHTSSLADKRIDSKLQNLNQICEEKQMVESPLKGSTIDGVIDGEELIIDEIITIIQDKAAEFNRLYNDEMASVENNQTMNSNEIESSIQLAPILEFSIEPTKPIVFIDPTKPIQMTKPICIDPIKIIQINKPIQITKPIQLPKPFVSIDSIEPVEIFDDIDFLEDELEPFLYPQDSIIDIINADINDKKRGDAISEILNAEQRNKELNKSKWSISSCLSIGANSLIKTAFKIAHRINDFYMAPGLVNKLSKMVLLFVLIPIAILFSPLIASGAFAYRFSPSRAKEMLRAWINEHWIIAIENSYPLTC